MVVEAGGTAALHQLAEGGVRGVAHDLGVDVLPVLVERGEPGEQLEVLDLGVVAREDLVEVVVRVHEAGVDDLAARVDDLVGGGRRRSGVRAGGTNVGDDAVCCEKIRVGEHVVRIVAGNNGVSILYKQRSHSSSSRPKRPTGRPCAQPTPGVLPGRCQGDGGCHMLGRGPPESHPLVA